MKSKTKAWTLSTHRLLAVIGLAGSVASIATWFVAKSIYDQTSHGDRSPNIQTTGQGDVSVSYSEDLDLLRVVGENKPPISLDQYALLKPGMSYEEVVEIVGLEGKELSSADEVSVFGWGHELYIYLTVVFVDNRLTTKSQSGL